MPKTLQQSVSLNASPKELYDTFLDSKKHGAVIGGKVSILKRPGASFKAHHGFIKGKNLLLIPNRMIVQSWRGVDWKKNDPDSILVLTFSGNRNRGRIDMIHANIPDSQFRAIKPGWTRYYWKPWRAYLRKQSR